VDGLSFNIKLSVKPFYKSLYPLYLQVGWASGFAVGYSADADSLAAAVPGSARYA